MFQTPATILAQGGSPPLAPFSNTWLVIVYAFSAAHDVPCGHSLRDTGADKDIGVATAPEVCDTKTAVPIKESNLRGLVEWHSSRNHRNHGNLLKLAT